MKDISCWPATPCSSLLYLKASGGAQRSTASQLAMSNVLRFPGGTVFIGGSVSQVCGKGTGTWAHTWWQVSVDDFGQEEISRNQKQPRLPFNPAFLVVSSQVQLETSLIGGTKV